MKILKSFWGIEVNFIKGASDIHKGLFSYENLDLAEYPKIRGISCKVHGEFTCNIRTHLVGSGGCKQCQYDKLNDIFKSSTEHYQRLLLDGKSIVVFNSRKEFIVNCKGHGDYTANSAMLSREGQGCPLCKKNNNLQTSLINYRDKLNKNFSGSCTIRGDYLYYTCSRHKTETRLSTKYAASKLNAQLEICKVCSTERKRALSAWTKEHFISISRERYGDLFEYDKLEYINNLNKVVITCKKHSDFTVWPNNHIRGVTGGCKECERLNAQVSTWKGVKKALRGDYKGLDTYFYVCGFSMGEEKFFKIGVARGGAKQRYQGKTSKNGYDVEVLQEYRITEFKAVMLEHLLLINYSRYVPNIRFAGYTECFIEITESMQSAINNYTNKRGQVNE